MHRIFETPELLSIICAEVPWSGYMHISRHFFHAILPYCWEYVRPADFITRGLIPANWAQQDGKIQASISQPLTPENMSRFHFYAPFVKNLSLYSNSRTLELDDWDPLISYSDANILFPNLAYFDCFTPDLRPLRAFLSSPTQSIRITSQARDPPFTSDALACLASKAPNIPKLEIYPYADTLTDSLSIHNIPPQTFVSLSELCNLRYLISNVAVLQPYALQLLAQLPRLRVLWIKADYCGPQSNFLLQHPFPSSSFPSLETLHIDLKTSRDVKRCWELIPLKGLTEAHISIDSTNGEDQSQFIPPLCYGSPLLRELLIKFAKSDEDGQVHNIQMDMFEHLGRLPLDRALSIASAKLDIDDVWDRIAMAWPNLREINCKYQLMYLEDLLMLSEHLPNLCRLECNFDFVDMAGAVGRKWYPNRDLPFYPNLSELKIWPLKLKSWAHGEEPNDLNDMARYFAYFWPNARIVPNGDDFMRLNIDIYMYEQGLLNLFRKLIKVHAQLFHGIQPRC
ncbi:hypothetical protein FRC12_009906 [Ceratobasidium sp. 428]|nr:hypothetical protein FRC12_009906 [Ceratobasidium sp. 428]